MVRKIITIDEKNIILSLPEEFVGKQVEILAFLLEDTEEEEIPSTEKSFTSLQIDTKGYKFNRDEANER